MLQECNCEEGSVGGDHNSTLYNHLKNRPVECNFKCHKYLSVSSSSPIGFEVE